MAPKDTPPHPSATLGFWRDTVIIAFLVIAGLVVASGVLIPLSLALLLFVLLTAVIERAAALRVAGKQMPRWLAHVLGFGLVFFGLLVVLSILSNQAVQVGAALPRYEERFSGILARIIALVGDENYASAQDALNDVNFAGIASGALSSAGGFLSGLFLVLLYIPFMFLERGPMRKKIRLAAPTPEFADRMAEMLKGISISLQRYVGIKTFVSALTGLATYAIARPVGLDFAETWGVLAFALNFIPTIGSILGVVFPAIVALVQFDSFTPFLIVAGGCGLVQFVVGNVLEPSLTGRSLNLSPLAVILSLTFWGAIWGMAGALLSVPITVCALIVLSYIPGTRGVAIMISGDGNLMRYDESEGQSPPGKQESRSKDVPAQGDGD